ncbi:polyprotein [Phytophthora megakarya]|uniref:Polyprotein n=1 Tax=Phytophthora megakarya TaxID=4795 RepID=A0A225WH14_9STRA|nr:polyprotein [Phytophthora megakarya]
MCASASMRMSEEIQEVKATLKSAFKLKQLGEGKFILGMEIDHDHSAKTLMIKHTRCIDDVMLQPTRKDEADKNQQPKTDSEISVVQAKPYRALIGCLLYIKTCSTPDVAYIVTQLSRLLENPA